MDQCKEIRKVKDGEEKEMLSSLLFSREICDAYEIIRTYRSERSSQESFLESNSHFFTCNVTVFFFI